jgi:hypothetical protein
MIPIDFSVLDPPRVRPLEDPEAHLQAAVHWHFGAEVVFPHWFRRARPADARGLRRVAELPAHGDRDARLAGRTDAEDLPQETMVKAYAGFRSFRQAPTSTLGYGS